MLGAQGDLHASVADVWLNLRGAGGVTAGPALDVLRAPGAPGRRGVLLSDRPVALKSMDARIVQDDPARREVRYAPLLHDST
jgi:hypothetical protein